MSDNEKRQNQKTDASTDVGQKEVQESFDEANEQGFFGITTDPTPNEHYTLQGNDLPTPETDPKLADKAAAHQRKIARGEDV